MNKTVKAKYANGALTPLERLDLAEDSVVLLTIEELPADESEPDEAGPLGVSDDSEPLIDMSDPRALKKLLDDEDVAKYLRLRDAQDDCPRRQHTGSRRHFLAVHSRPRLVGTTEPTKRWLPWQWVCASDGNPRVVGSAILPLLRWTSWETGSVTRTLHRSIPATAI